MTEPLKLRVGGVYLNRMGGRVAIAHDYGANETYRFRGDGGHTYTSTGRCGSNVKDTPFDLVSEVIEPRKAPPAPLPADDLRTRAALAAMTGILAGGNPEDIHHPKLISELCIMNADALIAALKEEG